MIHSHDSETVFFSGSLLLTIVKSNFRQLDLCQLLYSDTTTRNRDYAMNALASDSGGGNHLTVKASRNAIYASKPVGGEICLCEPLRLSACHSISTKKRYGNEASWKSGGPKIASLTSAGNANMDQINSSLSPPHAVLSVSDCLFVCASHICLFILLHSRIN